MRRAIGRPILSAISDDLEFAVVYNVDSVVLTVVESSVPGDFNNDGVVNIADHGVWRDNTGAATDAVLNDNGDDVPGVDADDYLVWKASFGASSASLLAASSANPAAVPEPAGLVVVFSAAALFCLRINDLRVIR